MASPAGPRLARRPPAPSGFTPNRSEDMGKHPLLHPTVVDPAPDRRGHQTRPQNAAASEAGSGPSPARFWLA